MRRYRHLLLVTLLAPIVVAPAFAGTANTATSRSNQQHNSTMGAPSCPKGQTWNSASNKCVPTDSINYNASKSNTGNTTVQPGGSSQPGNPH